MRPATDLERVAAREARRLERHELVQLVAVVAGSLVVAMFGAPRFLSLVAAGAGGLTAVAMLPRYLAARTDARRQSRRRA